MVMVSKKNEIFLHYMINDMCHSLLGNHANRFVCYRSSALTMCNITWLKKCTEPERNRAKIVIFDRARCGTRAEM